MNIIIVGAGNIGFNLAEYFSVIGHHITVVDQDRLLCEQVNSKLDVFVVPGIGSSPAALAEAGIDSADMLIAVTPNDETNLLACNFAMQNGVKKRIARIKSPIYTANTPNVSLEKTGATSVVEPERGGGRKDPSVRGTAQCDGNRQFPVEPDLSPRLQDNRRHADRQ